MLLHSENIMMHSVRDETLTTLLLSFHICVAIVGKDILIRMDCCLERRFDTTKGCYLDLLGWTERYGIATSKRTTANQKVLSGYSSKDMWYSFLFPRHTLLSNGTGNFYTHCWGCRTPESIEISCRRRNGTKISSRDIWGAR